MITRQNKISMITKMYHAFLNNDPYTNGGFCYYLKHLKKRNKYYIPDPISYMKENLPELWDKKPKELYIKDQDSIINGDFWWDPKDTKIRAETLNITLHNIYKSPKERAGYEYRKRKKIQKSCS